MLMLIYNMIFSSITVFLTGITVVILSKRSMRYMGCGFRKIVWLLLAMYLFVPVRIDRISRNVNDFVRQFNQTQTVQNIQQYNAEDDTDMIAQNDMEVDAEYHSLSNENELSESQSDISDIKDAAETETKREEMNIDKANDRLENIVAKLIVKNQIYIILVWIAGAIIAASMKSDKKEEIAFWIDDEKEPVEDEKILAYIDTLRQEMKIKSYVSIYYSEVIASPCMTGISHPVIFIPKRMRKMNKSFEKDFENIMKHELNHYKSGDTVYKLCFEIASVLLWFNPVIYFIRNRAYEDMEFVCDAKVTKDMNTDEIKNYCNSIIGIVPVKDNVFISFRNSKEKLRNRIDNCFDSRRYESGKKMTIFLLMVLLADMIGGNSVIYGFSNEEKIVQSGKTVNEKIKNSSSKKNSNNDGETKINNSNDEKENNDSEEKNHSEEKDHSEGNETKIKNGIDKTSASVSITEKPIHYDTGLKISEDKSIAIRDDFLQGLDEEEKSFVKEEIFSLHYRFENDLVRNNVKEKRGGESSVWLQYYDDPDDNVVPTYLAEDIVAEFDKIIHTVKNDEFKAYLAEIRDDFQNAFDNRDLEMLYMVHQKLHDLSYFAVNFPLGTLDSPPPDWHGIYVYFGTLERF